MTGSETTALPVRSDVEIVCLKDIIVHVQRDRLIRLLNGNEDSDRRAAVEYVEEMKSWDSNTLTKNCKLETTGRK